MALDHHPHTAEIGFVLFGAAPLFWFALKARLGPLQRINHGWDISYGVYLYGWPAAMIVLSLAPAIGPVSLAGLAAIIALACGTLSWTLIEQPTLSGQLPQRIANATAALRARLTPSRTAPLA